MYEIWETTGPPRLAGQATTADEALERLDAECRRLHQEAAGAGAARVRHEFEVRDRAGALHAALAYTPDPAHDYESIVIGDALREES